MRHARSPSDRERTTRSTRTNDHRSDRPGGSRSREQSDPAESRGRRSPVAAVQRTAGNQAVQRACATGTLQADLTVNQPGDPSEREAERVAEEVVSTDETDAAERATTDVQRTVSRDDGRAIEGETERRIQSARGGGLPLSESTRSFFESRLGRNFSDVRVHTGADAHELSRRIDARAFTTGTDVFFSRGSYDPGSAEGKRLLAHELTHVVQQGGAGPAERVQRQDDGNDGESLPLSWDVVDETPELSEREKIRGRIEALRSSIDHVETLLENGRVTNVEMNDLESVLGGLLGPGVVTKGVLADVESVAEFAEQGGWKSVVGTGGLILSPVYIMPGMIAGRVADPWISLYQNASAAIDEYGDEYVFSEAEMADLRRSKREMEAQMDELYVELNEAVDEPMRPSSGHVP